MDTRGNLTRRTVLGRAVAGALAAGALSGCSWISPEPEPPHRWLGLLTETRALLARYQAALDAHPGLAERLTPLRDNHRAHLKELARLIGPQASASPSPKASPVAAPEDEQAALRELRTAERDAQATAAALCLKAKPAEAGLLGSIAACRATHREVLNGRAA